MIQLPSVIIHDGIEHALMELFGGSLVHLYTTLHNKFNSLPTCSFVKLYFGLLLMPRLGEQMLFSIPRTG